MTNLGLLGPENTFHDLARKQFLPDHTPHYFKSFEDIFQALRQGQINKALIALSNSGAGIVGNNLEIIQTSGFRLLEKFELPINLCLGCAQTNTITNIQKIFSHPMAIKETKEYFSKYSHIKFVSSISTAGAIDELKNSRDKLAGVISSKEALENHGLLIIAENIQDEAHNSTTFGLISI